MKAIIFDLDGTLYPKKGLARRLVFSRFWEAPLMAAERTARKSLAGRDLGSAENYYGELFSAMAELTRKPPEKIRAWYFETWLPLMEKVLRKKYKAREGAKEFLEKLKAARFPFAVYSDYPRAAERLRSIGINPEELAAAGVPVRDTGFFGAQKPAPRPFLAVAAELGFPPADIAVVGDQEDTDGEGARAAGMAFVDIGKTSFAELGRMLA